MLAELADEDLERRRGQRTSCLERLGLREDRGSRACSKTLPAVLLGDTDPLLRLHGVAVARGLGLSRLFPRLRELDKTETDPWVRHHLTRRLP